MEDKPWVESKKFLALMVVLGVVLVLGLAGIIFHTQVQEIITAIVAFASTHQLGQGAQDFAAKWKGPAQEAIQKGQSMLAANEENEMSLDSKDFDPQAFA